MNESKHPAFSDADLEASLRGLGVTELEQRLEFSSLLAGATGVESADASVCCSCKIPPDDIFKDDPLPSLSPEPTPGGGFWGTGPTDGLGR